jgi:Ser/Thr protein kinase RdoA (MazF antagonist)
MALLSQSQALSSLRHHPQCTVGQLAHNPDVCMHMQHDLMLEVSPRLPPPCLLQAANTVMLHLSQHGIRCSTPLPVRSNTSCSAASSSMPHICLRSMPGAPLNAPRHAVRCLRYLEGQVQGTIPPSPDIQLSIGRLMGRVSAALTGLDLPALHHDHAWHTLTMGPKVKDLLPQLPDLGQNQR